MGNFARIAGYTVRDAMRHKSFYALLGICILFVLMIRGCYDAQFVIGERTIDRTSVVRHVSIVVFHLAAAGALLMTAVLSMSIFSKDRSDGSAALFLSRPVSRPQYVLGRVAGIWMICFLFMFALHATIFALAWSKTGAVIPGFLPASLISSVNLLFVVSCVCLLSLFMPDFISAALALLILFFGFLSDGGHLLAASGLAQAMAPSGADSSPALWRVLYPKVFMNQLYAGDLIRGGGLPRMGPFHPILNVAAYVFLMTWATLAFFNRKEI